MTRAILKPQLKTALQKAMEAEAQGIYSLSQDSTATLDGSPVVLPFGRRIRVLRDDEVVESCLEVDDLVVVATGHKFNRWKIPKGTRFVVLVGR